MGLAVDQRFFFRLAAALPVRARVVVPGREAFAFAGTTENLSAGGLLLSAPEIPTELVEPLLDEAGTIELEIDGIASGAPLRAQSHLVWMEGAPPKDPRCRYGLRFAQLGAAERGAIGELLTRKR